MLARFKRTDVEIILPKAWKDSKHWGFIPRNYSPSLSIDNRSEWPTEFLALVAGWVASELPCDPKSLKFVMQGIGTKGRRGLAYLDGGQFNCACHRRVGGRIEKYRKYNHATEFEIRTSVESLVHIIAHEMYHTTREGTSWFARDREDYLRTGKMGATERYNRSRGEVMTDRKAFAVVEAWRAGGRAKVLAGYRKVVRKEQQRTRQRMKIEQAKKVEKNSTEYKLEQANKKLAEWEAKIAHAEKFAAKYRRKIRSLRGAQTRKLKLAAAKEGK